MEMERKMDENGLNKSVSLLEGLHLSQYRDKFMEYNINARTLNRLINRPKSLLNTFMLDNDIAKLRNKLKGTTDETKNLTCNEEAKKMDSLKDSATRQADIVSDSGPKTANALGQAFRKLKESFRKLKKPMKVREYHDDVPNSPFFREILSKQLNLVTIGETDEGKLETLKSTLLLAKEDNDSFSEGAGMISVTDRIEEQTNDENILDSFGSFDSEKKESTVIYKLGKSIAMCTEGIHAFFMVFNGSRIFTDERRRAIDIVRRHFGTHFWNYAIIIIIGDELTTPEVQKANLEYLSKIKIIPEHSYEKRYVYIDNKNRAIQQVHQLVTTVLHNIRHHNIHRQSLYSNYKPILYTKKVLLKAQAGIEAELRKAIQEVEVKHDFVSFLFSPWRAILRSVILIDNSDDNLFESLK